MAQAVCSPKCAIEHVKDSKRKKSKKELRERKNALMTYSERKSKAQDAVNRYVRARDRWFFISQGKQPECISCGTTNPDIQYCAGHYKTRGSSPELALDPINIRLQCNYRCNSQLSGNTHGTKDTRGYIAGLMEWYGEEEGTKILEYLDGPHENKKYSHEELEEIRVKHNKMALELEKRLKSGCVG